jgi:hypothetical protein
MQGLDARCKVSCAAIGQVVTGHGSDHHVTQPQVPDGINKVLWLVTIRRLRYAMTDRAETAVPGAGAAKDEKRRSPVAEALADVGACSLLADGGQSEAI